MATELVVQTAAAIQALPIHDNPTPGQLLQLALTKDAAIDVIERITALMSKEREFQAKLDFDEAMNRCQKSMRRISADLVNPQTRSKYASYSHLDAILRPLYSGEGFSLSFSTEEAPHADSVRITCIVARSGHERRYQIDMPADGKGAKGGDVMTKTHATGAAATYGMRYLLKMIFNVAIGEDDTDGVPPQDFAAMLDDDKVQSYVDALNAAPNLEALKSVFADCYKLAKDKRDESAKKRFTAVYEAIKKEINEGVR